MSYTIGVLVQEKLLGVLERSLVAGDLQLSGYLIFYI